MERGQTLCTNEMYESLVEPGYCWWHPQLETWKHCFIFTLAVNVHVAMIVCLIYSQAARVTHVIDMFHSFVSSQILLRCCFQWFNVFSMV